MRELVYSLLIAVFLVHASPLPVTAQENFKNPALVKQTVFPLRLSANKRFFTDQNDKPFLYHADTGWLLYVKLTTQEAREYLIKRKQQGFNTIQTQIAFTPEDVSRNGERPFFNNNDFSKPNEKYFNHIASIISIADSLNLLIVMSQPWLDCCMNGWGLSPDKPIQKNGIQKNYELGKYLGTKFKRFNNLFWIMGGDHDPGDDRLMMESMAKGIKEMAPHQLITYHAAAMHSSTDLFQYAPWLGFSMIYTYWRDKPVSWISPHFFPEVYESALREYTKSDIMPFVLGESQYEGFSGNDIGTAYHVRRQAYWTMLCGGAGHAYGTSIWNFPANWREIMSYPGASHMKHFYNFFTSIKWWELEPDYKNKILFKGYGEFNRPNYITAALSKDSTFFVAYFPLKQQAYVDFQKFKSSKVFAQWFNPRTGDYETIGHFAGLEYFYFTPPTDEDWILYLKSE
jgi:hypothetical protein